MGLDKQGLHRFCRGQTPSFLNCLLSCLRIMFGLRVLPEMSWKSEVSYDVVWTFLWICDSSGETLKCNIVYPKMLWTAAKNFQMSLGCFTCMAGKRWLCVKPLLSSESSAILMWCVASSSILHPVRGHKIIRKLLQDVCVLCYVTCTMLWNQRRILLSREATRSVIIQECSKS